MAGLSAAGKLKSEGFTVKILESRNRIGGRIWTDRSLGVPVEMGASWIHESVGNPLTPITRKHQIKTVATNPEDVCLFDAGGRRLEGDAFDDADDKISELLKQVRQLSKRLDRDIPYEEGVRRVLVHYKLTELEKAILNWRLADIEADVGTDLSTVTFIGDRLGDKGFDGPDLLFPGGYDQVVDVLARDLDIELEQKVNTISQQTSGVKVETDKGLFDADAIIVTVPLGVLKSGKISFTPNLSAERQKAIDSLGMGTLDRVALLYEHAFWPQGRDFIERAPLDRGDYALFTNWYKFSGQPILLAEISGKFAREQEGLSAADLKSHIAKLFSSVPNAIPEKILMSRWSMDAFARGSYSYLPAGVSGNAYAELARPFGLVYFAGEATSRSNPATVHGAYMSGMREANKIAKRLG